MVCGGEFPESLFHYVCTGHIVGFDCADGDGEMD